MANKDREAARLKAAEYNRELAKKKRNGKILKWTLAIVGAGVVAGLIVSSVVANNQRVEQNAAEEASLELNVPELATATGSFAVDSTGRAIPLDEANSELPRVEFILDPHCSGCHQVETKAHDTIQSMIEDEEAQFFFTPVSFMNRASTDDYSARAASTLIEVAETDPEHFFDYIGALYDNFPAEGPGYPNRGVGYDELGRVAKSVGVSDEAIELFDEQRFRLWALENTEVTEARSEIFPDGLSTPTVVMGGSLVESDGRYVLQDFTKVQFDSSDVAKTFRDTFDSLD